MNEIAQQALAILVPRLLLINLVSTAFMTGLIWFVQVVHYPLAATVGSGEFMGYQQAHMRRTGWVVMPVMLIELAAAVAIVFVPAGGMSRPSALVALLLLGVVWLSTALLQVPCHATLTTGKDDRVIRRLVFTNWIRTLAWSARLAVLIASQ